MVDELIPSPNRPPNFLTSNPDIANSETKSNSYDNHTLLIRRYCYAESKIITLLHMRVKTVNDHKEVLNLKAASWTRAERLHEVKRQFGRTRQPYLIPVLAIYYAVALAIFTYI